MNNEAITPAPPNMEAAAHKETRDFLEWLWANCRVMLPEPDGEYTFIHDHIPWVGQDGRREIEEIYEKSL